MDSFFSFLADSNPMLVVGMLVIQMKIMREVSEIRLSLTERITRVETKLEQALQNYYE